MHALPSWLLQLEAEATPDLLGVTRPATSLQKRRLSLTVINNNILSFPYFYNKSNERGPQLRGHLSGMEIKDDEGEKGGPGETDRGGRQRGQKGSGRSIA